MCEDWCNDPIDTGLLHYYCYSSISVMVACMRINGDTSIVLWLEKWWCVLLLYIFVLLLRYCWLVISIQCVAYGDQWCIIDDIILYSIRYYSQYWAILWTDDLLLLTYLILFGWWNWGCSSPLLLFSVTNVTNTFILLFIVDIIYSVYYIDLTIVYYIVLLFYWLTLIVTFPIIVIIVLIQWPSIRILTRA